MERDWTERWVQDLVGDRDHVSTRELAGNSWLTDRVWSLTGPNGKAVVKRATRNRDSGRGAWAEHWTAGNDGPRHWNYWRREFLAYTTDLTVLYGDHGLEAPRLLESYETEDSVTLAMELVEESAATTWGADTYVETATRLGHVHGALMRAGAYEPRRWFCRGYLPDYAIEKPFDRHIVESSRAWKDAAQVGVGPVMRRSLVDFASAESALLRIVRDSPFTLAHNDFWTRNLFGSAGGRIVLIDWAFVGPNAIGADLANLVASAGFDAFVSPKDLRSFGEVMFDAYVHGLLASRWGGLREEARAGFLASFGKYAWVVAALLTSATDISHPVYVGYGDGERMDFPVVAGVLEVLARWVSELR